MRRRAMPWTTSTHAARQRPRGEHRPTTAAKKGVATGRNVEMWEHVGKLRENVRKLWENVEKCGKMWNNVGEM